ncbi:hypothetical protein SADUNF_Sadunf02G0190600 [Salix dunnii]|uniref:DNA/RNA-binding protein Alba-like domain-containing protein n=1 Tax=Salix dunnii TaxID=1413687 RepID=A0A835N8S4_9ROSI|nr:hypothetical protein SADUNF_Sadunf02G0190600 [Salix dunnii]
MDRYTRVEKPKPESPINENEIRITSGGPPRNYISYGTSLLQVDSYSYDYLFVETPVEQVLKEKHVKEIVLKAMGQAISKTVSVAEGIKRRNPRLHQDTAISSVSITDVWEPLEEGLVPVEQTRQVSMITITLSFKELNKMSSGELRVHDLPLGYLGTKLHSPWNSQSSRSSNNNNNNNPDKHVDLTMPFLKILMAAEICMAEDVVEGEDGTGGEVDMDMETIMVTTKEAIREIITGTTRETTRVLVMNIDVLMITAVTQIGVIMAVTQIRGIKVVTQIVGIMAATHIAGIMVVTQIGGIMVVRAMMVVTQIGAVVGAGAGTGVIVELDMKEEEVEGAEAMAMVVEGWPITQGAVGAEVALAMAIKLKKRMVFSPFASAKFLPRPVG